jgi:hypothetical protein
MGQLDSTCRAPSREKPVSKFRLFKWGNLCGRYAEDDELMFQRAFQFFDKDGNGDISLDEFREVLTELGGGGGVQVGTQL